MLALFCASREIGLNHSFHRLPGFLNLPAEAAPQIPRNGRCVQPQLLRREVLPVRLHMTLIVIVSSSGDDARTKRFQEQSHPSSSSKYRHRGSGVNSYESEVESADNLAWRRYRSFQRITQPRVLELVVYPNQCEKDVTSRDAVLRDCCSGRIRWACLPDQQDLLASGPCHRGRAHRG